MIRNQNAEEIVRTALIESTAPALDAALFSNTAASAAQPAGILVGATSVTASSSTDKLDAMGDDLSNLTAAIANFAGNGSFMFIANPAQAMRAAMYADLPVPMLMSAALASGTVIAVATNALASVVEPVVIDARTATTVHEEDTNPQTPTASPSKSMFQTACVALRVRLPVTWCIRNAGAVSVVTATKW
jgi:hypothetical protein